MKSLEYYYYKDGVKTCIKNPFNKKELIYMSKIGDNEWEEKRAKIFRQWNNQ